MTFIIVGVPKRVIPLSFPRFGRYYITLSWPLDGYDGRALVVDYFLYISQNQTDWQSFTITNPPAPVTQYLDDNIIYIINIGTLFDRQRYQFSSLETATQYFFKFQLVNIFGASPISAGNFTTAPRMTYISSFFFFFVTHVFVAFCGDGLCEGAETCTTCFFDCGVCCILSPISA